MDEFSFSPMFTSSEDHKEVIRYVRDKEFEVRQQAKDIERLEDLISDADQEMLEMGCDFRLALYGKDTMIARLQKEIEKLKKKLQLAFKRERALEAKVESCCCLTEQEALAYSSRPAIGLGDSVSSHGRNADQ